MTTFTRPPQPTPMPAVTILGLSVHDVDMGAALDRLDAFVRAGGSHHVITADASMLVMAQQDSGLRGIIERADLVTPDSVGVLWAARKRKRPLRERVSGVEIVERLCALSGERGYRLYFLGAAPGVAEQAAARMAEKYPRVQIVGTRNGFFQTGDEEAILTDICACRPDVLCVAMGIPRQEKWIESHRDRLQVPVMIGVGGTLDVLSGTVKRAPRVMQKAHLEWLWRVLKNPRKISKVLLLPRFVALVQRSPK